VKIPSPGIAQHFTDEVDWVLGLAVGIQLPCSMMIVVLIMLLVTNM
jgi:ABC-type nickel/cobalt efflux system permease component RcnA